MNFDLGTYLRSGPVIALVGATNDASKYGNIILKDLVRKGFTVVPVNPRAKAVDGIPAVPDLETAIGKKEIGLVVYVIPPKYTLQSLEEAKRLGLKTVWIQPGAGDEAVREYLEREGFDFLMDACVMVESL